MVLVIMLKRLRLTLQKLMKPDICDPRNWDGLDPTIAHENDVLDKINYEDVIEDFISRNTRRMTLFNRE